jgi:hypothetical protein
VAISVIDVIACGDGVEEGDEQCDGRSRALDLAMRSTSLSSV